MWDDVGEQKTSPCVEVAPSDQLDWIPQQVVETDHTGRLSRYCPALKGAENSTLTAHGPTTGPPQAQHAHGRTPATGPRARAGPPERTLRKVRGHHCAPNNEAIA